MSLLSAECMSASLLLQAACILRAAIWRNQLHHHCVRAPLSVGLCETGAASRESSLATTGSMQRTHDNWQWKQHRAMSQPHAALAAGAHVLRFLWLTSLHWQANSCPCASAPDPPSLHVSGLHVHVDFGSMHGTLLQQMPRICGPPALTIPTAKYRPPKTLASRLMGALSQPILAIVILICKGQEQLEKYHQKAAT